MNRRNEVLRLRVISATVEGLPAAERDLLQSVVGDLEHQVVSRGEIEPDEEDVYGEGASYHKVVHSVRQDITVSVYIPDSDA